jgi:alkanesulfonate monooxygenase SsuD/methylene tetrahydromethanopterin reductase-like flavin-dependent oxidoreductase (luciferase family)
MDVSIGLPLNMPGATGEAAIAWASRAEEREFPGIAASDRLVYPNLEPLVALGAAAAVTASVRMTVSALITPFRTNTLHMAKQVATVDSLSGGRLVLGICIGGIKWDYEGSGLASMKRASVIEEQISEMRAIWAGEQFGTGGAIGPPATQPGGPRVLYGGYAEPALRRGAKMTDGYLGGGSTADFTYCASMFDRFWKEFDREGTPWKAAHRYFALGPDAEEIGRRYVHHYYNSAWAGPMTEWMIDRLLTTREAVRQAAKEFEEAGCDDMLLFPCTPDIEQVDLLADALR